MIARQWKVLGLFLMLFGIHTNAIGQEVMIRAMTFNIADVRFAEANARGNARLERIAEVIQRVRPNVLLLNEIEMYNGAEDALSTAQHFIQNYLMVSQGEGLDPIGFESYSPGSNTGIPTGLDLDGSGSAQIRAPELTALHNAEQRAYGADCFGFGTFPGQYAMALLVDPKLKIDLDGIRTFQEFLWKELPGAIGPMNPDGSAYYSNEAWDIFRLSSKTFADVPIVLPNGTVLHALISHPTPPAFDGAEKKNKHRNRDEIRLIREYIDGNESLYDDEGVFGGLEEGASFVILGDLNADPVDGSSIGDPINTYLFGSDRLAADSLPASDIEVAGLDSTDTSGFRLRVDYVLPSKDIVILKSGIWRHGVNERDSFASDHFPVWMDLVVPAR